MALVCLVESQQDKHKLTSSMARLDDRTIVLGPRLERLQHEHQPLVEEQLQRHAWPLPSMARRGDRTIAWPQPLEEHHA